MFICSVFLFNLYNWQGYVYQGRQWRSLESCYLGRCCLQVEQAWRNRLELKQSVPLTHIQTLLQAPQATLIIMELVCFPAIAQRITDQGRWGYQALLSLADLGFHLTRVRQLEGEESIRSRWGIC